MLVMMVYAPNPLSLLAVGLLTILTPVSDAAAHGVDKGANGMPADHVQVSSFKLDPRTASPAQIAAAGAKFSIEGINGDGTFQIYVPTSAAGELRALVPSAQLVEDDVDAWMRELKPIDRAGYPNAAEVMDILKGFAADHPEFVKLHDRPDMVSGDGKLIPVLEITGNVANENPSAFGFLAYGWNDTNGDRVVQSGEVQLGNAAGFAQPYFAKVDEAWRVDRIQRLAAA